VREPETSASESTDDVYSGETLHVASDSATIGTVASPSPPVVPPAPTTPSPEWSFTDRAPAGMSTNASGEGLWILLACTLIVLFAVGAAGGYLFSIGKI